jgi:predicted transcriptional regulator
MNKNNVQYRRDRIIDLYSEGRSQKEIAQILKISQPTVHRDLRHERDRIKDKIATYLDEEFPFEHHTCKVGINKILKKSWDIVNDPTSIHKQVMDALSLAKDCYRIRLELLDDQTIIDQAFKFVSSYKDEGNEELVYVPGDPMSQAKF